MVKKRPHITYRIQSQLVTIHGPAGNRIRGSRKTTWRSWIKYTNILDNVRAAIKYVTRRMLEDHIGGIVVVRPVVNGRLDPSYTKIYQAKWGNDNRPFTRFNGLAGYYWQRRLGKS